MNRRPRTANWRRITSAVLLLGLATGALRVLTDLGKAADQGEAESTLNVPPRVSVKNGVTMVTLDTAAQQNAGIETARPTAAPAQETVAAYGTVLDAAQLTELGNRYLDAKAQVQTAQAKLTVSRTAFERAKTLYADQQNISAAQLQGAEGAFAVDQAALTAAQSHLATVVASAQQAWGPVLGKALIDGASLVEDLIERRDYLVKVTLPPGATVAKPPATASAKLGNESKARLDFISPATTIDPKIQGTSYFYSVLAESGLLPGLNVVVLLPGETIAEGLVVPEPAVVWLQGKAWVYLRTGADTFVRREIAPDKPAPGGGYIVTGLRPDARIVIRGAQMLLSEEFRAQVTGGGDQD